MTVERLVLAAATGALLGLTGCYVDFLDGLPCRDDGDCYEYACNAGACVPKGALGEGVGIGGATLSLSSISVVADDNGDGKVSPGETGHVRIALKNTGSAHALGIVGALTTSTPGVTISSGDDLQFGRINADSTQCGTTPAGTAGYCYESSSDLPTISVATSVSAGTDVALKLTLTDTHGNVVALDTTLNSPAIAQAFQIVYVSVVADDNGDGKVSPGETGHVRIALKNTGSAHALGIVGALTTSTPGVTISSGDDLQFGRINADSTQCGTTPAGTAGYCYESSSDLPTISVATSVSAGTNIALKLTLTDTHGNVVALDTTLNSPAIAQAFQIVYVSVVADDNGDGKVSPGETGHVRIALKNTGSAHALGIVGALTTSTPGVTISSGNDLQFGRINADSTQCGTTPAGTAGYCYESSSDLPTISVATSVSAGSSINLTLNIRDVHGNTFSLGGLLTVQ